MTGFSTTGVGAVVGSAGARGRRPGLRRRPRNRRGRRRRPQSRRLPVLVRGLQADPPPAQISRGPFHCDLSLCFDAVGRQAQRRNSTARRESPEPCIFRAEACAGLCRSGSWPFRGVAVVRRCCLRPVVNPQLRVDVRNVARHRSCAEHQGLADFGVAVPRGYQGEDFEFARGALIRSGGDSGRGRKVGRAMYKIREHLGQRIGFGPHPRVGIHGSERRTLHGCGQFAPLLKFAWAGDSPRVLVVSLAQKGVRSSSLLRTSPLTARASYFGPQLLAISRPTDSSADRLTPDGK